MANWLSLIEEWGMIVAQLEHSLQVLRNEIAQHQRTIEHYSPSRMQRIGIPCPTRLPGRVDLAYF